MKKTLQLIKNKFVITSIFLVVWVLFFDKNDLRTLIKMKREVRQLEEEKMKFLDEAKVYLKAGDGGKGCVSEIQEEPAGGGFFCLLAALLPLLSSSTPQHTTSCHSLVVQLPRIVVCILACTMATTKSPASSCWYCCAAFPFDPIMANARSPPTSTLAPLCCFAGMPPFMQPSSKASMRRHLRLAGPPAGRHPHHPLLCSGCSWWQGPCWLRLPPRKHHAARCCSMARCSPLHHCCDPRMP
jgi:hypothetical protein